MMAQPRNRAVLLMPVPPHFRNIVTLPGFAIRIRNQARETHRMASEKLCQSDAQAGPTQVASVTHTRDADDT
jgi:hypothetical protein